MEKIVWLEWSSVYFPDKEIVFAIAKDVTVRKEIQNEVEEKYKNIKSLAAHFKSRVWKVFQSWECKATLLPSVSVKNAM